MSEINKYNFNLIEIGQTVVYPIIEELTSRPDGRVWPDMKANKNRYLSLAAFARRSGRKFNRESTARGLQVTRVS